MSDLSDALRSLSTADDAWRFVRDFAAAWVAPLTSADGYSDEVLDEAGARLGVRLPEAVRAAYRLFGRRADLTSANGDLYPPDLFAVDAEVLVFRAAHQGAAQFGVALGAADPPVLIKESLWDQEQEAWAPFIERFSLACVDMVLWETVEAGANCDGRDAADGEAFPELTAVPFPRYPSEYGSQWYTGADLVVRHDPGWLPVAGRTPGALDDFRRAHPGDWVN